MPAACLPSCLLVTCTACTACNRCRAAVHPVRSGARSSGASYIAARSLTAGSAASCSASRTASLHTSPPLCSCVPPPHLSLIHLKPSQPIPPHLRKRHAHLPHIDPNHSLPIRLNTRAAASVRTFSPPHHPDSDPPQDAARLYTPCLEPRGQLLCSTQRPPEQCRRSLSCVRRHQRRCFGRQRRCERAGI